LQSIHDGLPSSLGRVLVVPVEGVVGVGADGVLSSAVTVDLATVGVVVGDVTARRGACMPRTCMFLDLIMQSRYS
jgi:hypothetical protein